MMTQTKDSEPSARLPEDAGMQKTDIATEPTSKNMPGNKKSHVFSASRLLKLAALIVIAGIVATAGYRIWQYFGSIQETDDAYITAHITPVSSRIETNVEDVLIDDNQHVKKGQLLIKLDPRDFQRKVDQARSELERVRREAIVAEGKISLSAMSAQASKLNAAGDISGSLSSIEKARVAISEAQFALAEQKEVLIQKEAERVRAEEDFKRFLRLENQGAVTTSERDAARRDFDVAKAACEATRRAIDQKEQLIEEARQQLKIAQSQKVQAQGTQRTADSRDIQTHVSRLESDVSIAAIKEAEAKLADAELKLSYCRIYSPVSGRVGRKTVELGQRVQPGARLFTLTEDNLWVVANFKENQLEKMKPGQTVDIKADILPHQKFTGTVESFSPGSGAQFTLLPPDNATGNFTKIVQRVPVKILFSGQLDQFRDKLVPGLSVIATVKVD